MNLNVYIYHIMESHEPHLILFQVQSIPMANNGIQALLAYHDLIGISLPSFNVVISSFVQITYVAFLFFFLTAPLNPNPNFELERIVNDLRIKYRTYTVELNFINVSDYSYMHLRVNKLTLFALLTHLFLGY
jgi:hypothetical protein